MGVPLESVAHVIQVALTPVFLLSGVGTLLNVFTTRLARVTDHMEHLADLLQADPGNPRAEAQHLHLRRLRQRTVALDFAVALGAGAGGMTALATLTLFVGALRDAGVAWALFMLFGSAVLFTVLALTAFLVETLLSWRGLRDDGVMPSPVRGRV